MPQQLAIGVSDAAGQLVHGLRASLDSFAPHHAITAGEDANAVDHGDLNGTPSA